jgi:quercetin dioxygenase-like cupin family protein
VSGFVIRNIVPLAACLWIAMPVAQELVAQQPAESGPVLTPALRFEQDVVVATKAGAPPKKVHVVVSNWGIHGAGKIERLPERGFMVVQLHSGNVTVTINGKEEKRQGGDFWTVPVGATMSVQVTSESAVLQTMAIR